MSFVNRNVCKTFNVTLGGSRVALANQECSEVTVVVSAGGNATIFDPNSNSGFILPTGFVNTGQEFTFRGITNSNQLSATGSGVLSYRTQFFSFFPEVR